MKNNGNGGSLTINAVDVTIAGAVDASGSNGGDGRDGQLFGRNGERGSDGGNGGAVTINADGNVQVSGSINVNGGNGGQGGDNNCWGSCRAADGGSGGNAGSVSIRAAQLIISGSISLNGGNGGKGGFGDGCDGHGGNGGAGGAGGVVTLKYIVYRGGSVSASGGAGGSGGGYDNDWYCDIDGGGSRGRDGSQGSPGTVQMIQRILSTITVTPATTTITSGSTQQFTASGYDSEGITYPINPSWTVNNPSTGSVNPTTGTTTTFTANLVGTTTLTASQNGVSGSATVTVTPGAPASINLVSSATQAIVGQGVALTATVTDAAGNLVADGTTVGFSTTLGGVNPASAQTTSGAAASVLSSLISGTATATASSGSATSNAVTVEFLPDVPASIILSAAPSDPVAGTNSTITAVVRDQYGNAVPGVTVTFDPDGAGVLNDTAPVTDAAGTVVSLLTATNTAGTYVVSATSGTAANSTTITVRTDALARIDVVPLNPVIAIDQPINLTAYGFDQYNNSVPLTPQWSNASNLSVGIIQLTPDPSVVTFIPVGVGQASVSALDPSTGVVGTTTVTVTPGPLAYIIISGPPGPVASGTTFSFTAIGYDSFGNQVTITPSWASENATVGTINPATGLFSALYPGTASVNATQGNVTNTTLVTVIPGAPAAIYLSVDPQTIQAGGNSTVNATVVDWLGSLVLDGTNVSFSSSIGSITPLASTLNGVASATFTSTQLGNATVNASSGAAANQTWVFVNAGPLDRIEVTPEIVTVASGSSTFFLATGYDQYNNSFIILAVNWTSSNTTVGTITDLGLGQARFDAAVAGTTIITASVGAVSDTAQATVTPGTLAWITVVPENATVPVGGTQVFNVTGYDSFGNAVFVQANWTVSGGIGSVSPPINSQSTTFTATAVGSGSVNAFAGAFTNSSTVTVVPNAQPVAQGSATIRGATTTLANGLVLNATTIDTIAFNSTSYDPDGFIASTLWLFGDGTNSTNENTTKTYSAGVYNALLRVTDNNGASSNISFTVNVSTAAAPVAVINATPTTIYAGESVFFDGAASYDPDGGAITFYQWSFGDDFSGIGQNTAHPYTSPGVYNASLTVTDDEGWIGSANVTITVLTTPGNLSGTVVDQDSNALSGVNVSLDGTPYWVLTEGTGAYAITGIQPGTYTARASREWYLAQSANVTINSNATTNQNFALTITGAFNGTVRDADTGVLLNGTIEVRQGGSLVQTAPVVNGLYWATQLLPGYYNLTATSPGYFPATQTNKQILGGENTTVNFVLWQ